MIEIRTLDGKEIELKSNEITIELNNSLFNDGSQLKGSFSYPVSLALSPGNIKLFGYVNQLEVSPKIINIPILLRAGFRSFRKAVLNISVTENSFEGTIKIGIGSISEKIKTVKLTELPFKKISLGLDKWSVNKAMMDAAINTDWKKIPFTFIPTRNADFYGTFKSQDSKGEDPKPSSLQNAYTFKNGIGEFSIDVTATIKSSQIVPYFYLPYVLNEIALFFGFTLTGDFISHPEVAKIIIYNINAVQFIHSPDYFISVAGHKHLPAITIAEFFKAISCFFCCRIRVDEKKHELDISWKKSVFKARSHQNWSDKLITVNNQKFVLSEGYTISAQLNGTEKRDEVVVLAGGERVEAKAGTIQFIKEQLLGSPNFWRIPQNNLAGNLVDDLFKDFENYRVLGSKPNDFPLRFLFTNGIVTENSISYPKGTNEGVDFNVQISGKKGLFNYAHKPWLEKTYAGKVIKAKFLLSENDINQLCDEDIIQIKSENGVTVECLIKKLTFTSVVDSDYLISEAEMLVLGLFEMTVVGTTDDIAVGTIEIFVRLVIHSTVEYVADGHTNTYADLHFQLFEDRKCTIPHIGNGVKVNYSITRFYQKRIFHRNEPPTDSSFADLPLLKTIEFNNESELKDTHVLIGDSKVATQGDPIHNTGTEEYWTDKYVIEKSLGYTVLT